MIRKSIEINNGEKISYFEQGTGKKTLVLIHGNTSSSAFFKPLFDRMPKDIKLIAPDLRGYGNTTYNKSFDSLKELAIDINLLLKKLNINEFSLLGWSLGGGVAMELSLLNKNAKHLILVASTTHYGYPVYVKDSNLEPILGKAYESKEEMSKDPLQVLPMLNILNNKDLKGMIDIYNQGIYLFNKPSEEEQVYYGKEALKQRSLLDSNWAISNFNLSNIQNGYKMGNNKIKDIKIPVLHINGNLDYMVPEIMLEQNYQALKDNSKVIKYNNCSHSPFVDKPDELTKDILSFISSK